MIYEGVEWVFKSLGRVFNFAINLNIIGDISMLDIFLALLVIFMLLRFLNFGYENNDGFISFLQKNVKNGSENAKQKLIDRGYKSKKEYKPKHAYINKHGKDDLQ